VGNLIPLAYCFDSLFGGVAMQTRGGMKCVKAIVSTSQMYDYW